MIIRFLIAAAGTALSANSLASGVIYGLEKSHADLLFSINHSGFSEKHGAFRDFDATLQYDPAHVEQSRVTVTVKSASIDTALAKRDDDLRGTQFLDVAKFPEITFVSTHVTPGPAGTLVIEGDLTLHGTTRAITLTGRLNKFAPNPFDKKPTLGYSATGSIRRSDFGILTLLPIIGDDISITIDAEFNRQP
jgi:polyisoprenoid-binding protein YceI